MNVTHPGDPFPRELEMNFKDGQPLPTDLLGQTIRIEGDGSKSVNGPGTKAFLSVIRSRADLGFHVFIDGPVTIGRDPNCSVPLHDFGVSRTHAEIKPLGDGDYLLEDLRSTNGTRVNGSPIKGQQVVRSGDKIFIGDTVLRFSLADEMEIDFHSEVATLVSTDPLTGLPSKRRFDQALEFALQAATQSGTSLAILMMDMDGVKQINDTHGHLFGAHVIGQTGRLIAGIIKGKGQACRFGGDEFSAFLPGADANTAKLVAEELRHSVENAGFSKQGIALTPTISIGVTVSPNAGKELLDLIAVADKALYQAKDLGKNCVACLLQ